MLDDFPTTDASWNYQLYFEKASDLTASGAYQWLFCGDFATMTSLGYEIDEYLQYIKQEMRMNIHNYIVQPRLNGQR